LETIKEKIGINTGDSLYKEDFDYEIIFQQGDNAKEERKSSISTNGNHLERLVDPKKFKFGTVIDLNGKQEREDTYKIVSIPSPNELILDSGLKVKLLGVLPIEVQDYKNKAILFLKNFVSGNKVYLKYDNLKFDDKKNLLAYVYLTNKTFLNAKLIMNGLARCDKKLDFQHKDRFIKYEEKAMREKMGIWEEKGLIHA
jgi:site-specific DNA-methyltransferase (adenine-specific)